MAATATASASHPRTEVTTVGLVSTAHAFSHFYMLVLPPLFPLLHAELGFGYAALGLLLTVYAVTTGVLQVPMGLLVDRIGGRAVLTLGLALNAAAIALVGLAPGYWGMLACMVLAGVGNSVFHPADYAILAARVAQQRIGRAFSMHLFAGYIGWMLAAPAVLGLTALFNWRAALVLLGLTGLGYAALLATQGAHLSDAQARLEARQAAARARAAGGRSGIVLLLTPVIASLFLFYMIVSMAGHGIQTFSMVALIDLHGISLALASSALTAYFIAAASGTLLGGWLADRVTRPHLATAVAFILSATCIAALAIRDLPVGGLLGLMFLGGFFIAVVAPLRDVMVRNAAPPGTVGTAFGIVTTGFSVGLASSPLILGWFADVGRPQLIFWAIALITLLGIITLAGVRQSAGAVPRAAQEAA